MPEFLQSGNPQLARNIIDSELSNVQVTPQEEEPIQVDAGYDDDCCNQIRQMLIQINEAAGVDNIDETMVWRENGEWKASHPTPDRGPRAVGKDAMTLREFFENIDCEELLRQVGESESEVGKTFNDIYNECAAGKMPQGGDFTTGEPMDLAWRLLKNA